MAPRLALLLAAALAACTKLEPAPEGVELACTTSRDCPGDRLCSNERCVAPDQVDERPPALAGAVLLDHARVRAGGSFSVSFTVDEPLAGAPRATIGLLEGNTPLTCTGAGPGYTCSFTPTGGENGGKGGEVVVGLSLTDLHRNTTPIDDLVHVELDFAPPEPLITSVAYEPGAGNPLPTVARATGGTKVRVVVSANEEIVRAGDGAPVLTGRRAGAPDLDFTLPLDQPLHLNDVLFEAVIPGGQPDGEYDLHVTWADDLENGGSAELGRAVSVKTTPPALVVAQEQVVFLRSPVGNQAAEQRGSYTLPAGPYFALEPADTLSGSAFLPDGALLLEDGVTVPSAVLVQSETAQPIGTLWPDAGRFRRGPLVSPDLATVFLVGVDDAGNRSEPVKVQNAEWVATTAPGAFGASPHALSWMPVANGARPPPTSATRGSPDDVTAKPDGSAMLAPTWLLWRPFSFDSLRPPLLSETAVAYDPARAKLVVFGGGSHWGALDDVWEWDGSRWRDVSPGSEEPLPTGGAGMVFDGARGRLVMHGGYSYSRRSGEGSPSCSTYEWEGGGWSVIRTTGRELCGNDSLMTYDSRRGRVMLLTYGALDSLEGSTFTLLDEAGPDACAFAYDPERDRLVVVGGASTWEWNEGWAEVPSSTGSPDCESHLQAMAYDPVRHRMVFATPSRAWERIGTDWREIEGPGLGGPVATLDGLAFDSGRSKMLLVGEGRLLEWDGTHWRDLEATGLVPTDGDLVFDPDHGRSLLLGTGGELTAWSGSSWRAVSTAGGGPGTAAQAAYDTERHRLIAYANGHSWAFDDAGWTDLGVVGSGAASSDMVYDAARRETVLVEVPKTYVLRDGLWRDVSPPDSVLDAEPTLADLADTSTVLQVDGRGDAWTWDGVSWLPGTSNPAHWFRTGHALAYDTTRSRALLFGGFENPNRTYNDLYEWDGSEWADVTPRHADPTPREDAAVAFDSQRDRLVLFGGGGPGIGLPRDTWELDCSTSRTPAVQFDASARTAGFTSDSVSGIRVRAWAGGTHDDGGATVAGARLFGWSSHVPGVGPGWAPLSENVAGLAQQQPYLPDHAAAELAWVSTSAEEARRFFLAGDRSLAFQVRPTGPAGVTAAGAQVALDYLEVRIRYAAP